MPVSSLAVQRVIPRRENRIEAVLTCAAVGLEAADPGDVYRPDTWLLLDAIGSRISVANVTALHSVPGDLIYEIDLPGPLVPGGTYSLAVAANAQAAGGQVADPTPCSFVAALRGTVAAQAPGILAGDIASPGDASATGDLSQVSREDALRARVLLLIATSAPGAFTHLPNAGRQFEPKRNYTAAALLRIASQMKATIRNDPDVTDCTIGLGGGLHYSSFQIAIVPVWGGAKVVVNAPITAGGT